MSNTIPGVYNYCDRWCERCALSHRCLLFLQELDDGLHQNETKGNVNFWETLENTMKENIREIEEFISDYEEFIPPKKEAVEAAMKDMEITGEKARNSNLVQFCITYRETLKPWLDTHDEGKMKEWFFSEQRKNKSENPEQDFEILKNCIEVIHWYYYFMEAKFYRALTGKIGREEIRFEPDYPTDSEASAKIAMIAVDRSRNALITLWDVLDKKADEEILFKAIAELDIVKREALKEFPNAPGIKRPGFDD